MVVLGSNVFGLSAGFTMVSPGLYGSPSGNFHVLGSGHIGGKGDGLIFLDQARQEVTGYDTARALVVSHDWFGIAEQPLGNANPLAFLDDTKLATLFDTIEGLKLSGKLAIRASAQVEDMRGNPAAGVFGTEFHGRPLNDADSKRAFIAKLISVCNSAYTERAQRHWRQQGYSAIPPVPVIIQDVVGAAPASHSYYFFPLIAGVSNGAFHTKVRVRTVLGMGGSAVDAEGLGTLHSLPILEGGQRVYHDQNRHEGRLNDADTRVLDVRSGDMVRLRGADAKNIFSDHIFENVFYNMPDSQMAVAGLNLAFERMLGCPVDLEWASADLKTLSLLQSREVQKRPPVKKPDPSSADILVESSNVFGFGSKTFTTVICARCAHGSPDKSLIEDLTKRYPHSLIVYATEVVYPNTYQQIEERIFPHTDTLVLHDLTSEHWSPVLSHFDLNCEEVGKILVHTSRGFGEEIYERGTIVEEHQGGFFSGGTFTVYQLNRPLVVAGDSEFEWGMVYWSPEGTM